MAAQGGGQHQHHGPGEREHQPAALALEVGVRGDQEHRGGLEAQGRLGSGQLDGHERGQVAEGQQGVHGGFRAAQREHEHGHRPGQETEGEREGGVA